MNSLVSAVLLKRELHYDPLTGIFRRRPFLTVRCFHPSRVVGTLRPDGYVQIKLFGRDYLAHRLAFLYMTERWPEGLVDHKDGDRSNNLWANLRLATASESVHNTTLSTRNKSGVKGVSLHKASGKWQAFISHNNKPYFLGLYEDLKEAAEVVRARRELLHGDFTNHGEITELQKIKAI